MCWTVAPALMPPGHVRGPGSPWKDPEVRDRSWRFGQNSTLLQGWHTPAGCRQPTARTKPNRGTSVRPHGDPERPWRTVITVIIPLRLWPVHTRAYFTFTTSHEAGTDCFSISQRRKQAQRGKVICPKSHSQKVTNPGGSGSHGHALGQSLILHKGGTDSQRLGGLKRKQEVPSPPAMP